MAPLPCTRRRRHAIEWCVTGHLWDEAVQGAKDVRELVNALAEVARRMRADAETQDAAARREPSYRARSDAAERADRLRADAKVVDAAHSLLAKALNLPA